jgi:hypothetical protein
MHCSAKNVPTIRHMLSVTAFCIRIYRARWRLSSFKVICGILGNYTASCGNYLPTFRDKLLVSLHSRLISPIFLTPPQYSILWPCIQTPPPTVSSYWLLSHRTVPYPDMLPSFLVIGFLSFLESWPVKMGPTRCPETSVNNYHTMRCNYPEDHRLHQHRGGSLKSKQF